MIHEAISIFKHPTTTNKHIMLTKSEQTEVLGLIHRIVDIVGGPDDVSAIYAKVGELLEVGMNFSTVETNLMVR